MHLKEFRTKRRLFKGRMDITSFIKQHFLFANTLKLVGKFALMRNQCQVTLKTSKWCKRGIFSVFCHRFCSRRYQQVTILRVKRLIFKQQLSKDTFSTSKFPLTLSENPHLTHLIPDQVPLSPLGPETNKHLWHKSNPTQKSCIIPH